MLEIADDALGDVRLDADGRAYVDHEHINRSRLRVDARKWYLAKLAPKRYGDKAEMAVTGHDGGPLFVFNMPSHAEAPGEKVIEQPSELSHHRPGRRQGLRPALGGRCAD